MAFRKDKPVAVLPLGICRIVAHDIEIESYDDLDRRQRPAGMAGFSGRNHLDHFAAHALREGRELIYIARGLHVSLL